VLRLDVVPQLDVESSHFLVRRKDGPLSVAFVFPSSLRKRVSRRFLRSWIVASRSLAQGLCSLDDGEDEFLPESQLVVSVVCGCFGAC